jgi:hypothetical protein
MQKPINTLRWSKSVFNTWLISNGISIRAASNYISRCKRIEENLGICLLIETRSELSFQKLMKEIQKYADKISPTKESAYALTGSLRLAARKFAQCHYKKKAFSYPSNHGLSRYEKKGAKKERGHAKACQAT